VARRTRSRFLSPYTDVVDLQRIVITDGIKSAIEQARAAANGKNVAIAGAARCSSK
jgi:hypothetical protein